MKCKVGGLVVQRHDEVVQQLGQLCVQALKKSAVHAEPLISHWQPTRKSTKTQKPNSTTPSKKDDNTPTEERGDLLVRGLWRPSSDCIIDVRLTDTDQKTYLPDTPYIVLEKQEQEKKKKYSKDCQKQRKSFTPFVVSIDGMFGKEAQALLKNLAFIMANKWDLTYSQIRGYLNSKISIAILRAAHRCIRCSRIPTTRICRNHLKDDPPWADGAGLGLFHQ